MSHPLGKGTRQDSDILSTASVTFSECCLVSSVLDPLILSQSFASLSVHGALQVTESLGSQERTLGDDAKIMFKNLRLETRRLLIRPFSMDDLHALHGIVSQTEVMKYLPENVMSLEQTRDILAWLIECYDRNSPEEIIKYTLATIYRENRDLIGWCGLGPLAFDPTEIEIYYGLSQAYWRKGLATEAAKAMLEYAFLKLNLPKIVAVVHRKNPASKRVIEKLGMTYEKTDTGLPAQYISYEGDLFYALSRAEYLTKLGRRRRSN